MKTSLFGPDTLNAEPIPMFWGHDRVDEASPGFSRM
jgi:hypothetical protein